MDRGRNENGIIAANGKPMTSRDSSLPISSNGLFANGGEILDVLIAGAGFSGLGMAIRLRQEGKRSFLIIEKADDIGGTWYFNQYPGCACDIPSHLYSFSFDCNPEWTRMYSGRQEIQDYLKACADRHGLMPYIRLNAAMRDAAWDEAASVWRVTAYAGSVVRARGPDYDVGVMRC